MKAKLVTNGKYYAARKWSWFYMSWVFLDLNNRRFWWKKSDDYFPECCSESREDVERKLSELAAFSTFRPVKGAQ